MLIDAEAAFVPKIIRAGLEYSDFSARRYDRIHAHQHPGGRVAVDTSIDHTNVESSGAQHRLQLGRIGLVERYALAMDATRAKGHNVVWLRRFRRTERDVREKKSSCRDGHSGGHGPRLRCLAGNPATAWTVAR